MQKYRKYNNGYKVRRSVRQQNNHTKAFEYSNLRIFESSRAAMTVSRLAHAMLDHSGVQKSETTNAFAFAY